MLTILTLAAALLLPAGPPTDNGPPWVKGGVNDAIFSPDGKAVLTYRRLHNKYHPGELALWDATRAQSFDGKTRNVLWSAPFAKENVRAMTFSADGKLVLTVERDLGFEGKATLRTFDAASGKPTGKTHELELWTPTFAAGGSRLIGSQKAGLAVWDTKTGELLLRLPRGNGSSFGDWSASPDGKRLLTWDDYGPLREWDLVKGKELRQLLPGKRRYQLRSVAYVPGRRAILLGHQDLTWGLFDDATGKQTELPAELSAQYKMHYSPDGKKAVTIDDDVRLTVRDAANGKELHKVTRYHILERLGEKNLVGGTSASLRISPDGKVLLIAGLAWGPKEYNIDRRLLGDRTGLVLWDLEKGEQLRLLAFPVWEQ